MASLDSHFVELSAKGMALGVMEAITLEERRVTVQPGDLLILYTDGVTEPINEEEEEFGEQRLLQVLDECWDLPSTEIVQRVHRSVTSFVGEQPEFDDYTLVCLKRKP
jgi:sigma-B regulation protein RsbU (phosphoserine phosphatase)